ncbi:RNB domain-containing ribonuclease [Verrucosispora sioxanthis]|uniref:RNB domain-containing ribonuclease n=1 Tax=Verrucosispora sioxanthis TaxID=2499994 RepID=UPI001C0FDDF7|nr:RNB domain-containing ribonuclease [Verrucosispora sioxanthis]
MVIRRVLAPRIDFGALRRELGLPETYPEVAQREADEAAAAPPAPAVDHTDIPLVTVDPPGSRDLDQAMHLSRRAGGYRVRYAIADVAAHVRPGGALEDETWRRGQTVYLPDGNVPLHPRSLGEGAASLLPDVDRAAVLWTIDLDADGGTSAVVVQRALVRSRAQLAYPQVQADAEAGRLPEPIALLPEIGALLTARGLRRGAVNLPIPEQDVEADGDGWRLVLRAPVPMEEHNAQISLLTGMVAADLMLAGGIGLLRTMPAPKPEAVQRLRAAAAPLGVHWPDDVGVGELLLRLDPGQPRAAAFIDQAAELMRSAAYTSFDGEPPEQPAHGGVAAAYAHVTAPLRRLADRYATEVCLALHDGRAVPDWARAALPRLPAVLAHRVGETFDAAVVDVDAPSNGKTRTRPPGGTVALDDPPVRARCLGELPLGTRVRVRLVAADPATRSVAFELA